MRSLYIFFYIYIFFLCVYILTTSHCLGRMTDISTNIQTSRAMVKRPENWNREQNDWRIGPGTGAKSESFLEPDPEPADETSQL